MTFTIPISPERLREVSEKVRAAAADSTPDEAVQEAIREFTQERLQEQAEDDLCMHRAFRPEVVSEIAVYLGDDSDWSGVADWCGGKVCSGPDGTDSGEWTSWITVPGIGDVSQGEWLVKRFDGTFAVRTEVGAPDGDTLADARRQGANAALLDFARVIESLPDTDEPWTPARIAEEARRLADEKHPIHGHRRTDR